MTYVAVKSASAGVLETAGVNPLGKLLLPRLNDPSERCRDVALTTLLHVAETAPGAVLALLPYAVPVLKDRLVPVVPVTAPPEQSEELRCLLIRFAQVMMQHAQASLPAYCSDFVLLLEAVLQDSAPDVATAACGCCQCLASTLQSRIGAQNALQLAERVTVHTGHNRAAVRLAALDALHALVLHGAHAHLLTMSAYQHPNQVDIIEFYGKRPVRVNWLGKLATDHNAGVRARLVAVLADWMLHLRERADHTPRLLPFLLSGLTDATDLVVETTERALDALGQMYEAEHAEQLADLARYAPQTLLSGGPHAAGPHTRLGTRLLVQEHLSAVLPPCLADMRVWTTDVRPRALALLKTVLTLAGAAAGRHASSLAAALCECTNDDNPVARQAASDCCVLLAMNVTPDALAGPLELLAQENGTRQGAVTLLTLARDAAQRWRPDEASVAYSDALTRVTS